MFSERKIDRVRIYYSVGKGKGYRRRIQEDVEQSDREHLEKDIGHRQGVGKRFGQGEDIRERIQEGFHLTKIRGRAGHYI
jgi:hypothetical protein